MATVILGMSKISSKFQITIPKDVRERFKLEAGSRVLFLKDGEKLVLRGS
jgi:looped-hinge helix DNA binding domain, AbrB family